MTHGRSGQGASISSRRAETGRGDSGAGGVAGVSVMPHIWACFGCMRKPDSGSAKSTRDPFSPFVLSLSKHRPFLRRPKKRTALRQAQGERIRSEEHTSELKSLMRTSYAVFCLKKKTTKKHKNTKTTHNQQ